MSRPIRDGAAMMTSAAIHPTPPPPLPQPTLSTIFPTPYNIRTFDSFAFLHMSARHEQRQPCSQAGSHTQSAQPGREQEKGEVGVEMPSNLS